MTRERELVVLGRIAGVLYTLMAAMCYCFCYLESGVGLSPAQALSLERELRQLDRDLREDMKGEAAFIKELKNEERRKDMSKGMESFK